MVKTLLYCPQCKTFTENKESPPPLVQKKLIEEGVETWIDTKLCLECSEEK
jgi:phosphoribosyl-ATP pyrophosphohydrolase